MLLTQETTQGLGGGLLSKDTLIGWLTSMNFNDVSALIIAYIIIAVVTIVLAFLANLIAKKIILHYVHKLAAKTATRADDIFVKNKVFHSLAHIAPGTVVYLMANIMDTSTEMIQKLAMTYIILVVTMAIFRSFDSIVEYTRIKSPAKGGPLKGILQVAKIVVIVFTVLLVIINFMGNSTAWAIFSSIGGLSAILLLVFKDSILGLVAGVQLSADGLLKLGDWLEMPKYNADGEVVDISLTKITVRNWDKTYTTIPAYKFLEDSFKNWQGMTEAGGRRIKRCLYLDMNTIGFLSEEQIGLLNQVNVLKPYINERMEDIESFNRDAEGEHIANLRKMTNIGTFRKYVEMYLKAHPGIHDSYTLLVRQLAPGDNGLPLELYCFTNDTAWGTYESIQADIFDHLLAILPEFGLRVYQKPTGGDFVGALTERK